MEKIIDEAEIQKAKTVYMAEEKRRLVDRFEKYGAEKTDYSITEHGDSREFFYGVTVMKDGILQGFNIMKFDKFYDEIGCSLRYDDKPYTDKDGKQIYMSVDEYYEFYKSHEQKDERLGSLLRRSKEAHAIENIALNHSKLGKLRHQVAQKVDRVFGTDLQSKKISKSLKEKEKIISDKLLGKVKD